jgi:hypothetical protein
MGALSDNIVALVHDMARSTAGIGAKPALAMNGHDAPLIVRLSGIMNLGA